MSDSKYRFYCTCVKGFEFLVEKELKHFECDIFESGSAFIKFSCEMKNIYKVLYCSRLINKIVLIVKEKINVSDTDILYKILNNINWQKYFNVHNSFVISSNCSKSDIDNSMFLTLKSKDAIVDFFRSKTDDRPDIDKDNPDVYVDISVFKNKLIAGINLNGQPLYKRGYKKMDSFAPVKETLAASIIEYIYPSEKNNFVDPMCGSGTFIFELLMKINNIPGCYFRNNIAFHKLNIFNKKLFENTKQYYDSKIKLESDIKITGLDVSPKNVKNIRDNINKNFPDNKVEILKSNFFNTDFNLENSLVLFNPPYNHRLKLDDINNFYKKIGDTLKHKCKNSIVYILTSLDEHIKKIGLRTNERKILFNGKIECRLLKYEMY